jgi:hypothetical protein
MDRHAQAGRPDTGTPGVSLAKPPRGEGYGYCRTMDKRVRLPAVLGQPEYRLPTVSTAPTTGFLFTGKERKQASAMPHYDGYANINRMGNYNCR